MIARAWGAAAGLEADNLDAVRRRLDDAAQVDAVSRLQAARWGDTDPVAARNALRLAFANGPRWRTTAPESPSLLPPLYPE